jgi:formylglycine-generating enzyme required for sulfatase activity
MNKTIFIILFIFGMYPASIFPAIDLSIESVRKDGIVTLTSAQFLEKKNYEIINIPGALCTILSQYKTGNIFRIIARIESAAPEKIKTGEPVQLEDYPAIPQIVQKSIRKTAEPKKFKVSIVSKTDIRQMNLIRESYFYFGSERDKNSAIYSRLFYLPSFYMDVYEVSNGDYLKFVDFSGAPFPRSWGGIKPDEASRRLPVMASYSEAEKYALWAGKRLPSETEWEKAASGSKKIVPLQIQDFSIDMIRKTIYPWGDAFLPEKSVSNPFWLTPSGKQAAKQNKAGLQPVLNQYGVSAFGIVNIAGNAPEWTSTWYDGQETGQLKNLSFGKQYKVIKGGGWYSTPEHLKISSREFGGIPNLDEDSIAGFRCVKDVSDEDAEQ